MKKAVLLINLGTPNDPSEESVKNYLTEFLNDPDVIMLPSWIRRFLVKRIIIPSRLKHSTSLYERLWTEEGSPIAFYLKQLQFKLQREIGEHTDVYSAMRYGKPALVDVLKQIGQYYYDELMIMPLYPQYANSTNGSALMLAKRNMAHLSKIKSLTSIPYFYEEPGFINAFTERINAYQPATFDHIIFSFHSLPISHIERQHPKVSCADCTCTIEMPAHGDRCYKAHCYETARSLANKLNLKPEDFTVGFQSRFAKKWIGPFTEDILLELARAGKSRVLVAAPSFVADCLETIVEIGQDYKEMFEFNGGKELVLVESLNDQDTWVKAIAGML